MRLTVTDLLPPGNDGTRTLLPKQQEFLNKTLQELDKGGPKFISYIGGIGSGKTVIGCLSMLMMGVMKAGDYLVCRQFYPELKITTYKTFMEMCPPELIVEHRVADLMIKIKAVDGFSNFYFRPLEDPDKYRSMNLNAFLIDEANQVSEEAFLLLQGRLRGKGWRKGIVVSNPNGHDWLYRSFVKQDYFKTEEVKKLFYLVRAPSTENRHLPEGYLHTLLHSWSEDRIKREIEGSFDAFEGAVYPEFRRDVHVIKPFKIDDTWTRVIGIDHGYRNPAAWVWVAIGPDGEAYVYKEFYESEWLINEIVNGRKEKIVSYPGAYDKCKGEKIFRAYIDPSTKARRGTNGQSDFDEYYRLLPKDFPLYTAINDVQVGIDRVKSYLKIDPRTNKPNLYIFDTCKNLLEEMTQYRYLELRPNQEGKKAESERPVKVNDHAVDALRYCIVTLPEPNKDKIEKTSPHSYVSSERKLWHELQQMKRPKPKDPFGSGF